MYAAMALFLPAWAVRLTALLPVAGPLEFVVRITRFQIKPEERVLRGAVALLRSLGLPSLAPRQEFNSSKRRIRDPYVGRCAREGP